MKTHIQHHKVFNPVTLTLSFDSEHELTAFKLRMLGYLESLSVSLDYPVGGVDCGYIVTTPVYLKKEVLGQVWGGQRLYDADCDMAHKINKQLKELNK